MSDLTGATKQERLSEIFGAETFAGESSNTLITALDDSSITGPEAGLRDMENAVKRAVDNGTNAILGFPGLFEQYGHLMGDAATIVNLTLSTEGPHHLRKIQVGTVDQIGRLGLTGASVHVNTTSPHEPDMLAILGRTAEACAELGIPLLAHMYPRTIQDGKETHYDKLRQDDPNEYARMVRHATRIAADLGADIIKVPFTGDAETFGTVVESAYGLPVVMAGGPKTDIPGFLKNAHVAMEAGASGIAVGRNFFQQPIETEGDLALSSLYAIVHLGYPPDTAALRAELFVQGRKLESYDLAAGPGSAELPEEQRSFVPYRDLLGTEPN